MEHTALDCNALTGNAGLVYRNSLHAYYGNGEAVVNQHAALLNEQIKIIGELNSTLKQTNKNQNKKIENKNIKFMQLKKQLDQTISDLQKDMLEIKDSHQKEKDKLIIASQSFEHLQSRYKKLEATIQQSEQSLIEQQRIQTLEREEIGRIKETQRTHRTFFSELKMEHQRITDDIQTQKEDTSEAFPLEDLKSQAESLASEVPKQEQLLILRFTQLGDDYKNKMLDSHDHMDSLEEDIQNAKKAAKSQTLLNIHYLLNKD
jgi:DNA repair exonuclease SbcCD ATPase subunit